MASSMGSVLTGLANGLSNIPQQLNDLAFQQASRQQSLEAGSIQNQQAALQLQQAQQNQQNQQQYQQDMVNAWQGAQNQSSQDQSTKLINGYPSVAQSSAAANPPQISSSSYGNLAPLQRAGITLAQLDNLAQQNGVPAEIAYGVIASESQGNPNAVSPKGALGPFQVMPSTATQPGFGVAPFDPKSPQGAMSYMGAMWKKAGGDPSKFSAMWNAGPGGNPNNPETRGFTNSVMKNAQAFKLSQTATQMAQQPSAADQITVREEAGVDTPAPVYKQAIQAQNQQINTLQRVYTQSMQQGHPAVAQMVMEKINNLQSQQLELQTKGLAIQKNANEQTASLAAGVRDQSSYNNLRAQVQSNPAMQQAVAGLGLTWNYDLDRNKLQTLADRSVTLKDQQEIKLKQAELQLKENKDQREQAKAELPKIISAQAQQADDHRQKQVSAGGLPFSPSLAATAPVGTTPMQLQQAQKQVAAQNSAYDKANAPAVQGAKNVRDQAAQAYVMIDKGHLSTGGAVNTVFDAAAPWALNAKQQEFNKLTNGLVQSMQMLAAANGGARSASTAAMYKNFSMAKPNIRLSETANKEIAHSLYVGAAAQTQMNSFLDEYRQSNPDATVQSGVMAWRNYEQALGPTMVYDASQKSMRPNMAGVPTMEDGSPNPDYKDYHVYFANGGKW